MTNLWWKSIELKKLSNYRLKSLRLLDSLDLPVLLLVNLHALIVQAIKEMTRQYRLEELNFFYID